MTVCRAKVAYMFGKTAGAGSSAGRRIIIKSSVTRRYAECNSSVISVIPSLSRPKNLPGLYFFAHNWEHLLYF